MNLSSTGLVLFYLTLAIIGLAIAIFVHAMYPREKN